MGMHCSLVSFSWVPTLEMTALPPGWMQKWSKAVLKSGVYAFTFMPSTCADMRTQQPHMPSCLHRSVTTNCMHVRACTTALPCIPACSRLPISDLGQAQERPKRPTVASATVALTVQMIAGLVGPTRDDAGKRWESYLMTVLCKHMHVLAGLFSQSAWT